VQEEYNYWTYPRNNRAAMLYILRHQRFARPIEALLGLFCVLTAVVLNPDEEGKIQSKLEDFWIRVDDFQNLALTRHVAFMVLAT
jgi:hypothetical protein